MRTHILVLLFSMLCIFSCIPEDMPKDDLRLWYDQPALNWNEALPVGNGRLGAMVFGGVVVEPSPLAQLDELDPVHRLVGVHRTVLQIRDP